MKSSKKKVTLSVETAIYDRYKDFCEKNAIMLSKKVELFMQSELEKADAEDVKNAEEKLKKKS